MIQVTARRILALVRLLAVSGWRLFARGIIRLLAFCENWLVGARHARYGVAVMRILLGVVGFGLLWSNYSARSYLYGPASFWNGEQLDRVSGLPEVWILGLGDALAGDLVSFTVLYLAAAALALAVVLGWRIRLTLPLFFVLYVGIVELNSASGDQGDNAYRICLFWLMFADPAGVLSLDARRRAAGVTGPRQTLLQRFARVWRGERLLPEWLQNAMHNLVLVLLTAQVTFIYVAGGLYKAGGEPWADGTAVYGPLQVAKFSTWPELADLITAWGPMVALASWGSIMLQISFPFMLLHRFTRVIALVGILGFHAAIDLLMGLPWFSLSMVAIDAIFVRDRTWLALGAAARDAWHRARAAAPDPSGSASPESTGSDGQGAEAAGVAKPAEVVELAPRRAVPREERTAPRKKKRADEPEALPAPLEQPAPALAAAPVAVGAAAILTPAPTAKPATLQATPVVKPAPTVAPASRSAPRPVPAPRPAPAPMPPPAAKPKPPKPVKTSKPVESGNAPAPEPAPSPLEAQHPVAAPAPVAAKVRTVGKDDLPAWARGVARAEAPAASVAAKKPAWLEEATARAKAERRG